jgi:hypothetical protein
MKRRCCVLREPARSIPTSSVPGPMFSVRPILHVSILPSYGRMKILCNPSLFLTEDVVEYFLLITSRFSWKWRADDRDSKTDAKSERPWVQSRYVGQGLVFCTWCKYEPIGCRHSKSALNFLSLLLHCLQSYSVDFEFEGRFYGAGNPVIWGAVFYSTQSPDKLWRLLQQSYLLQLLGVPFRVFAIQSQHIIRNTGFKKLF